MICEHNFVDTPDKEVCSKCGKEVCKTEIYSRVCGYLRPTSNWNDSKQAEFSDRVMFNEVTPDIYNTKV